jgi:hypothetical protein
MHLHSVESRNHFPTGGDGSRHCNTKLPALMVTDTIADIPARFDPRPELRHGHLPTLTGVADAQALRGGGWLR